MTLNNYAEDEEEVFKKCQIAYEYHKAKLEQSKGKKEEVNQKKESNICWNDYELVETIVFEIDI